MAGVIKNTASAVIVAGGAGRRMNSELPKQFMLLCGKPVLLYSVECFDTAEQIKEIIVVLPKSHMAEGAAILNELVMLKPIKLVEGGKRRQDSVLAGLEAMSKTSELAVVHDAARAGITKEILQNALNTAFERGSAVCAIPSADTLVEAENGVMKRVLERNKIFRVQTPQIFNAELLKTALITADSEGLEVSDESSAIKALNLEVCLCEGHGRLIKLTNANDFEILKAIFEKEGQ